MLHQAPMTAKKWRTDLSIKHQLSSDREPTTDNFDPKARVHAVGFGRHLRSEHAFSTALEDALSYLCLGNDDSSRRLELIDHSRRAVQGKGRAGRGRNAVGATTVPRLAYNIDCIALYSDASPVTREEPQGMIIDICLKEGRKNRSALPYSALV